MKKVVLIIAIIIFPISLISWGFKGHRAIATIAQKHLTANTAYIVSALLKGESMADVSTWADENKNRKTSAWHFLNLPLGLNHQQFIEAVSTQGTDNVYTAILKVEASLKDKNISLDQKNEDLKYLIHLVGDAHQPMHISRKEDKGGNTIQVRFDNKGTNLHSLWDSRLIDHEGLNDAEISTQYDVATTAQIKKWQADSPMEWIWESYQISSEIYAVTKSGQNVDEAYYKKYILTIHQRIDQAGIRLSGELNKLFKDENLSNISSIPNPPQPIDQINIKAQEIKLEEIKNFLGKFVYVKGKVFSTKDIGSMVLINLGAAYPNQLLTIALKGKAKDIATQIIEKSISIEGTVIDYKGRPEIIVNDPEKIKIVNQ